MKSTKIIATIGPASDSKEQLHKMIDAGMDVARLNFSHGSHEYFRKVIKTIRSITRDIPIMLDTKGPEVRTGIVKGEVMLSQDEHIILTTKEVVSDGKILTVHYDKLLTLGKGDKLAIDDGIIELKIVKKGKDTLTAKIIEGGVLGSKKGVSIPGHRIEIPFLTKQDINDIKAFDKDVDLVAASFVRCADDIRKLRKLLKGSAKIIAKIEHWESVEKLEEIIDEADGIMIARGDLGVEINLEKVPQIQNSTIRRCNELAKPVIVATQMLESMKINPRPTRAEVGDVANAIMQGTDAVMLSGETTVGKYPVQAVAMMAKIAREYDPRVRTWVKTRNGNNVASFVAESAFHAANRLGLKAILTPTESGFTARNVSRFKPHVPILAMTPNEHVHRQLRLSWGVHPICIAKSHKQLENVINQLVRESKNQGFLKEDDWVVVTGGYRLRQPGGTNLMEISKVNDIISRATRE